ncbi:MAG: tetratricopeptide repeat protein [Candidatus Omnitrophota bacterium]
MKFLVLGVVLAAVFLSFRPCLDHQFLYWDDDVHVFDNSQIRGLDLSHLKQIFTATINKTYVPLTSLSFALEYHWAGNDPFIYHLDNVLLHLGVVAMVFLLAMVLGLPVLVAGGVALLFGLHPMHVESVAWVTERKDVLYAFFYLMAVYFYIRYIFRPAISLFCISLLCALLSVLAKSMALSLPLVLLVLDWFLRRPMTFKNWLEKVPYAMVVIPVAWVTYSLNARLPGHDIGQAFLIWIWTFMFYIVKFVWPYGLVPLYSLPQPVAWANPHFLIPVAGFLLVVGSLYYFRRDRWYVLAWAFYIVSIFFLLRFDHAVDTTIVADRFMYLPCLGFCLWLGKAVNDARLRFPWTGCGVGVVLLILSVLTYQQCLLWKNDLVLWQATLKVNPRTPIAFNNIGNYFYNNKDWDHALENYSQAIALEPAFYVSYSNRGVIYYSKGQYDLALADFNMSLAFRSSYMAYNNRGSIYLMRREWDLALADFNQSVALRPDKASGYYNRGEVYRCTGRLDLALAQYARAIELDPKDTESYFRRAAIYEERGSVADAVADYQMILRVSAFDPQAIRALQRLGRLRQ